jgi:hypothetical protein
MCITGAVLLTRPNYTMRAVVAETRSAPEHSRLFLRARWSVLHLRRAHFPETLAYQQLALLARGSMLHLPRAQRLRLPGDCGGEALLVEEFAFARGFAGVASVFEVRGELLILGDPNLATHFWSIALNCWPIIAFRSQTQTLHNAARGTIAACANQGRASGRSHRSGTRPSRG